MINGRKYTGNVRRIGILTVLLIFLMTGCGGENTEVKTTERSEQNSVEAETTETEQMGTEESLGTESVKPSETASESNVTETETSKAETSEIETSETETPETETPESKTSASEAPETQLSFVYEIAADDTYTMILEEIEYTDAEGDYLLKGRIYKDIFSYELALSKEQFELLESGQTLVATYFGKEVYTLAKQDDGQYIYRNNADERIMHMFDVGNEYWMDTVGNPYIGDCFWIDMEYSLCVSAETAVQLILPDDSSEGGKLTEMTMTDWYGLYEENPLPEWGCVNVCSADGVVTKLCPAFAYSLNHPTKDWEDEPLAEGEELYWLWLDKLEKTDTGYLLSGYINNPHLIILTEEQKTWVDAGCLLYGVFDGEMLFLLYDKPDEGEKSGVYCLWNQKDDIWKGGYTEDISLKILREEEIGDYSADVPAGEVYYRADHYDYEFWTLYITVECDVSFAVSGDAPIRAGNYYMYGVPAGERVEQEIWTMDKYYQEWYEQREWGGPMLIKVKDGEITGIMEFTSP